jgi:multiple sugar transport system substrate-binding protein
MRSRETNSGLSRRDFLGLTAGAGALLLAACGGGPATPTGKAGGDGPASLQVWGGVPPESGPAALIGAFRKAHPKIEVTYTRFTNDDTGNTKLDSALEGGVGVDVFFSYDFPRLAKRITGGLAIDLSSFVAGDKEVSSWTRSTAGIFMYKGKYYSLPTSFSPNLIYVNRDLTQAGGADVPQRWTISQLETVADRVSTASRGQTSSYGIFAPPDIALTQLGANYWYANGGRTSNFANPAFRTNWQLHRQMITDRSAFPWQQVLAQNLRYSPQSVFLTGQVAMMDTNPFALRYLADATRYPHTFVTTFAPEPSVRAGSSGYNTGALSDLVSISSRSKYRGAAWTFARYWLTTGARYMLQGGKIPALPGALDEDTIAAGMLGPDRARLFDVAAFKRVVLNRSVRLSAQTITTAAAEIRSIVQSQTDRYLIGEVGLDATVEAVKQQADAAIAKG